MFAIFPGYSGLAKYGRWQFLTAALMFALLLDFFLIVNYYWTALITPAQRNLLLGGLLTLWTALQAFESYYKKRLETTLVTEAEVNESIVSATALYLQRNWDTLEVFLLAQLKKNPRDIELLLLQATLYRRLQRIGEATAVLHKLTLLNGANRWFVEIENEKQQINNTSKFIDNA